MPVTIKEIAALANVSRGTVDKVLNNRPGVKDTTREKVLKIAKQLNYQPNFIGKALVHSRDPIKLGIILTPDYNPFVQDLLTGINNAQEEFSAFGIEVITKMMTSLEPAEQLSIINELVEANVSGMAVFPLDDPQVFSRINHLIENQMAVITFNSRIEGIHDLCFVGQNHYKGGRTAAGLLGKIAEPDVEIGVIISSHNLSCHQDRLHGFQDKLAESYPNVKILDIQENQDRKEDAFRITLEYCNKYPNLGAIYLTSGGITGVINAQEIAEKNPRIKVICHDITPDTIHFLKNGTVDFALGQSPVLQGYQLVKTLFEYLIKNIRPQEIIEIPVAITTDESL